MYSQLLGRARELLNAAAEQTLPKISATYARQYFDNAGLVDHAEESPEGRSSVDDIDDLLFGGDAFRCPLPRCRHAQSRTRLVQASMHSLPSKSSGSLEIG
jgi:hypothetical protein